MKMNIVNCFSIGAADSGNPAAIVRDFKRGKDEKQELARQLNLPVTVFLSDIQDNIYNIEYFYPETEMSLCLHGTIGAAYILLKESYLLDLTLSTKDKRRLNIRMSENAVQVQVSSQSVPSIKLDTLNICNMLNIKHDNINSELPFLISSVGSPKLLIPIKSFELLKALKPNFDLIAKWSNENCVNGFYVYTNDTRDSDCDFYARGFNPKGGHHEDAATGVAAAALSLALKQSIVVGQGVFLNRPSKITVSYENEDSIWVGGIVRQQTNQENTIFKKMNENDFHLLHQWFQIPHILKWYARNETYTLTMIKEKYLPRITDNTITSYIIYDQNKPVGYIQVYHVSHHLPEGIENRLHPLFDNFNPDKLAGIDFFIADENHLHTGFSSHALKIFIDKYLKSHFQAILVDPIKNNTTAIKFFEKNGFKHILSKNEDHYVMIKHIEE